MERDSDSYAAQRAVRAVADTAQAVRAAHAAASAAKAGGSATAGTTAGTAAAGPAGAVIAGVVTSGTFWKVLAALLVSMVMTAYVIANIIPIIMNHIGIGSANELVDEKGAQEITSLQTRITDIFEHVENAEKEMRELTDGAHETVLKKIEKEREENYPDCTGLSVTDEYDERMKRDYARYLACLLKNTWDSGTVAAFAYTGEDDFTTALTSPYDDIFERASEKYDVSLALIKAIGKVESDYNPKCRSSAGAMGIMQLMPEECKEWKIKDPYDPEENIMAGAKYIKAHINAFKGHKNGMELAVAAYNCGGGAVRRAGYQIPDITETKNYVKKIFSYLTPVETEDKKTDYEALYEQMKKAVEDEKEELFTFGFDEVREERGEKTACYQLILGKVFEQKTGSYSYKLVLDEETLELAVKLLKAAESGKEAVLSVLDSVRDWFGKILDFFSGDGEDAGGDTSGDTIHFDQMAEDCISDVVYYNQGEKPWADMPYGSSTIRHCGCGPTACAIVFSTLLKKEITPELTCKYAMEHGEYTSGAGTNHSFPANAAKNWGISCKRVARSEMNTVVSELKKGKMAVVICAPNTITSSGNGHYITLAGVTTDGKIRIADPGSRERTGKIYTVEQIKGFARDLSEGSIWIMGLK